MAEHSEKSNKSNTLKKGMPPLFEDWEPPLFEDWEPPTAAELESMFEKSQRQLDEINEYFDNPENWLIAEI